jgi:bifunctional DNase/RNase
MIETVVESIRVNLVTQNRVVMLKEVQGERHLPIWIGDFEAQAIAMELQGLASPRPLPYDLMKAMIVDMGGTVDRIMVTDLAQDVFYARIVIAINGRSVEIDSRPSDAIALAVRTHSPIMVEEMVMERAGVSLEGEGEEGEEEGETPGEATTESTSAGVDEERLGVFRDFINTLDLDDFDRKRGS